MKKFLFVVIPVFLCLSLFAAAREVSPQQTRNLALSNARALWGSELEAADPLPLYGPDESIIAWQYDFAIAKAFPDKSELMAACASDLRQGNWEKAFRKGEFAYMLVGADRKMPVIIEFSKTLSMQYIYGEQIATAASQAFPEGYEVQKTYYMGPVDYWTCVSDGRDKRYINVEPKLKVLDETAFRKHLASMTPYWERDNYDEDWAAMLDGTLTMDRSMIYYIPEYDKMPFYIWHEGCVPTTGAMIATWWEQVHHFGKLDQYHMTKWDDVQDQYDHHVTDTQLLLHSTMGTDGEGGTWRDDICDGYENAFESRGYGCESDGLWAASWEPRELMWNVRNEITNNNLPIHTGIPEHAVACIGFSNNPDIFYVHDPNNADVVGYNRGLLEAIFWVHIYPTDNDPGDYGWVDLISPNGGSEWNGNTGGETLNSGDIFEITWSGLMHPNLQVRLYYHAEGAGDTDDWVPITLNTENDGSYHWLVPEINCFWGNQSDYGRIKIELYDPALGQVLATDGSYGNFMFRPDGSLPALNETPGLVNRNPDYFSADLYEQDCWYAISNFDDPGGGYHPWDIELFDSPAFTGSSQVFSGETQINYMLVNNHQKLPHEYGVKVRNDFNQSFTFGELTQGIDITGPGTYNLGFVFDRFVKVYDLSLQPGSYYIEADVDNATSLLDLDLALYAPGGDGIFGFNEALVSSRNVHPGGTESVNVTVNEAGIYGLVISSASFVSADYTLRIYSGAKWTGNVSSNWHEPDNWLSHQVPTMNEDVLIPAGRPFEPHVYAQTLTTVRNLTLAQDAFLYVQGTNLSVYGNFQVQGQLVLDDAESTLEVQGNLSWEANSGLSAVAFSQIVCYGNWTFQENAQVRPSAGIVQMVSQRDTYIANLADNCYFNDLVINKQGSATLYYSQQSVADLIINGQLTFLNGKMGSASDRMIVLKGQMLYANGGPRFDHGTFKLDQSPGMVSCGPDYWFNNLMIDSTAPCNLVNTLNVKGNLSITAGGLNAGANNIIIKGDFSDHMIGGGFNKGTSTVTFDSGQQSSCYNVQMNVMVISNGTELHFDSGTSDCASYDWVSGTLYLDGGNFSIMDLADNGLFGNYVVNSGYLYILQDPNQRLDLRGSLNISGGLMRVEGGYGGMALPMGGSCTLNMSGGILHFLNSGLTILDSGYSLTTNLTGGTIRLAGNLSCSRANFLPMGTTFEIRASASPTQSLYCVASSRFGNLLIDSGPQREGESASAKVNELQRMAVISLMSDINLYGDLIVNSGTLDLAGFSLLAGNDIDIHGTLIMNGGTDLLSAGESINWFETALGTLNTGEIRLSRWLSIDAGSVFQMSPTASLRFVGEYPAFIHNLATGTRIGQLYLAKDDAQELQLVQGSLALSILGNVFMAADNYLVLDGCTLNVGGYVNSASESGLTLINGASMTVNGNYYDYGTIFLTLGNLSIGGDLHLNGSAYVNSNTVEVTGKVIFDPASVLNVGSGIFRWLDASAPYYTELKGNVSLGTGLIHAQNHSLRIATPIVYNPGNGNLMAAGFTVTGSAVFNPTSGNVTISSLTNGQPGIISLPETSSFFRLIIDGPGGAICSGPTLTVQSLLNIESGRLDLNGATVNAQYGVTVQSGGILEVDAGAKLKIEGTRALIVRSGGLLQCLGMEGLPAEISSISGKIGYQIRSGATIAASHAIFKSMDGNGLQVQSGATVDPSNNFTACTFTEGTAGTISSPSQLLSLNNSQEIVILNAVFPARLLNCANVSKTVNQGMVYLIGATGEFAGENYDGDSYHRISWGELPPVHDLTVSLQAGGNYLLNWTYPFTPSWFKVYASDSPDLSASPEYFYDTVDGNLRSFSEPATGGRRFFLITAELQ